LSREDAKDENQEPSAERQERNHNHEEPEPGVRAVVDFGDTFLAEYRRNNKEQGATEAKNQTIAWAAVIAATALAAIGIWQACLTRQSNQTALDMFHASERARIAIGRPDGVLADFYQFGGNCGVYVYLRNIGHTTAKDFTAEGWSWDDDIPVVNIPAVNSNSAARWGADLPAQSPYVVQTIIPCDQVSHAKDGKTRMVVLGRYRFQPEGTKDTICEYFAVARAPNMEYFQSFSLHDMPMCTNLPPDKWNMGFTVTRAGEDPLQAELKAQLLEQMNRALSGINLGPSASPTPAK
jgi:hypothetical protein